MLAESSKYNILKISCSGIVGKFQFFDSSSTFQHPLDIGTRSLLKDHRIVAIRKNVSCSLIVLFRSSTLLLDYVISTDRSKEMKQYRDSFEYVNDMTFDNRQFIITNILIFSRFDRYLDLLELHVGVGSVNNHL